MGGGGGLSPIPLITLAIFGPEAAGFVTTAMGMMSPGRSGSDATADAAAETRAAEAKRAAADVEAAVEERRRENRKRQEAVLLGQARSARRADLAGASDLARTLGAPSVATSQLKEKLGQ